MNAFFVNDLIPYMGDYDKALQNKKSIMSPVLSEASCLCQLQSGILGSGNGEIIESIKEFSVFMKDLAGAAADIFSSDSETESSIDAVKAQAWLRKWQKPLGQAFENRFRGLRKVDAGSTEPDRPEPILFATVMLGVIQTDRQLFCTNCFQPYCKIPQ